MAGWLARLFGLGGEETEFSESEARAALAAIQAHPLASVPRPRSDRAIADAEAGADDLIAQVRRVGRARYAPAIPILVRLWRECSVSSVAFVAGVALLTIGVPVNEDPKRTLPAAIPAARDALRAPDVPLDDRTRRQIVAQSYLRDVGALADSVEAAMRGEPRAIVVTCIVLEDFAMYARIRAQGGVSPNVRHANWLWSHLERDGWRLLDHAARVRSRPELADAARNALLAAPPEARRAALARHPAPVVVRAIEPLGPYRRGDGAITWELLSAMHRIDGALRARALEVARERMRRVAHHADVITERLRAEGWPLRDDARQPATGDLDTVLREVEAVIRGPVPVVLEAFWREVGQIDWSPRSAALPAWVKGDLADFDPLILMGPPSALTAIDEWRASSARAPELEDPLIVSVTPGRYYPGAARALDGLDLQLPDGGFDPSFVSAPRGGTLWSHLSLALAWGGFPGLDRMQKLKKRHRRIVDQLVDGLEPL